MPLTASTLLVIGAVSSQILSTILKGICIIGTLRRRSSLKTEYGLDTCLNLCYNIDNYNYKGR